MLAKNPLECEAEALGGATRRRVERVALPLVAAIAELVEDITREQILRLGRASLEAKARSTDPLFFAVIDNASGRAIGYQTFLRIDPPNRVIEVGNILYTAAMQRTAGATEAQYLFAKYVFEELGDRRYEWKCNALNAPSRRAAERFGFTFEGIFRQHMIVKGRNRDTAWFAMLDSEWPSRKAAYERWLAPDNFDSDGGQKVALSALMPKG